MPYGFFSLLRIQLRTYPGGGQEAEDILIATELRLEYGDGLWLSLEFNELVVTSRLLLDLIGELLQPPVFFVDDLSAFALEDADELLRPLPLPELQINRE